MTRIQTVILAIVPVLGCGDADEGMDSGETGSGTAMPATSSMSASTSTSTSTSTSGDASTTGDASTSGGGESGSETSSSTGGGDSTTAGAADCTGIKTMETCDMTIGCTWIGPENMGVCVDAGDNCSGVMFEMQCNFIPGCVWDEKKMECHSAL